MIKKVPGGGICEKCPLIAVILIIICCVYYVNKFYLLNVYDDLFECFFPLDYNFIIIHPYHGRIISSFLTRLLGSYLPITCNIHPYDFHNYVFPIFKGILLTICFYYFAKIITYSTKSKILLPFVIFITYIFYQIHFIYKTPDSSLSAFFGYTFPFIFYFILFYNILDILCKNENTPLKQKLIIVLFAFLTGQSTEFTNISAFFSLIFLIILHKKLRVNKLKEFLMAFFSLSIGMLLYFLNPGFLETAHAKGALLGLNNSILNVHSNIHGYLHNFKDIIINDYGVYFVVFIILFYLIWKFKRNENDYIQTQLFILSILFGIFVFECSLLFCGEPVHYIVHYDLVMMVKIVLFLAVLFEIFYVSKKQNAFAVTFSLLILILFLIKPNYIFIEYPYICMNFKYPLEVKNVHERDMQSRYLNERIMLYYLYQNKIPTVMSDDRFFLQAEHFSKFPMYPIPYLSVYYNININDKYSFLLERNTHYTNTIEEAYKVYTENGGPEITEEEIKKHDFLKLRDVNYVLNGLKK